MSRRSLGSLTLDLIARIAGFERGMDQASRVAEDRRRRIERSMRNLQRTVAAAFGAIGGTLLFRRIVQETAQWEGQLAQLDAALRSTGMAAGLQRSELVALAQDMAQATTHSTGEIVAAQTRLLSYTTIVGEEFPRALQAAIDQSIRLGIGIEQSAEIIARAIELPSRGMASLQRQGFQFTEEQRRLARELEATGRIAEAQAMVLEIIEESYGGAAEAARNTLGGALASLRNSITDLMAADDGLPGLTSSVNQLADQLRDPALKQGVDAFATGMATIVSLGAEGLGEFGEFGLQISRNVANLTGVLTELDRIEIQISEVDRALNNSWLGRPMRHILRSRDDLQELREELEQTRQSLLESMGMGPSAPTAPTGPVDFVAPPSEEFLRLEAQLRQQIALFGESGQAARIAYQIQSGALDELSAKEQEQILRLSQQLDGLNEAAAAARELEQAQASLQRTYENQVNVYQRQIDLVGEVTELERLRYEIARGGLAGIEGEQRAYLELLASQVDALNEAAAAEREMAQMRDQARAITEQLQTPLERYEATIEELNELLNAGALEYEAYSRAVTNAQDALDDALQTFDVFRDQLIRNTQDIFADTLFRQFDEGLDGMLKSFGEMLRRMLAQAVAARLTEAIFGGVGAGNEGSALFRVLGGIFGGGRATGGPVSAGRLYRINEIEPEYFVPAAGGQVVPLSKMGGAVTVNVAIDAPRGSVTRETMMQTGAVVERAISRAARRNG